MCLEKRQKFLVYKAEWIPRRKCAFTLDFFHWEWGPVFVSLFSLQLGFWSWMLDLKQFSDATLTAMQTTPAFPKLYGIQTFVVVH